MNAPINTKNYSLPRHSCLASNIDTVSVIDLSVGDPGDAAPPLFKEEIATWINNPRSDRYPPPIGVPELLEAIASHYSKDYGICLNPNTDVCVTPGARLALYLCLQAQCCIGGVVAYIEPAFFGIPTAIKAAGMTPLPLKMDALFGPDADLNETFRGFRGGVFVLNNPHNPTGIIFSAERLKAIAIAARANNVKVLYDFVYKDIYEDKKPDSFLQFDESALEVCSFSKSFRMTGWRCGFVVGKGFWMEQLIQLRKDTDNGVPPAIQLAAASVLQNMTEVDDYRTSIVERRRYLANGLAKLGWGVKPNLSDLGTTFVWARIPTKFRSSDDAASQLASVGVLTQSGSVFGTSGEGFVRFALNYPPEVLELGLERIARVQGLPELESA